MYDAIGRRLRWRQPTPPDKRFVETERDPAILRALHRHGPLPSTYLHAFAGGAKVNLQRRLSDLYDWGYISRPPQYQASFHARYSPLVYDLTEKGKDYLSEEFGEVCPYIKRSDPMIHRLFGACVSASLELKYGKAFISAGEILTRAAEKGIAEPSLTVHLGNTKLIPDNLFALKTDDKLIYYAVEIDRNTESIERTVRTTTTFTEKLEAYKQLLDDKLYKSHWAISNLHVLTVTTNAKHAENLAARVENKDRFTFKVCEWFGPSWRVPPILDLSPTDA